MPNVAPGGTPAVSSSTPTSPPPGTTDMNAAPGVSALTPKDIRQLMTKANKGNEQALDTLCAVEGAPWFWERFNMPTQALESLLKAFFGPDALLTHEAQRRQCAALRRELEGPAPTAIERLLVSRIVLCWLHVYCVEAIYGRAIEQQLSITQHDFHQRRLSQAQSRYLAAIRTLAQVRRLQAPHVQVNIAEQQLNVAAIASAQPHQHHAGRSTR